VTIPVQVKSDKTEAVFENGILTLTIPKAEEVKPESIKVKAKGVIEEKKQCYSGSSRSLRPQPDTHSPTP